MSCFPRNFSTTQSKPVNSAEYDRTYDAPQSIGREKVQRFRGLKSPPVRTPKFRAQWPHRSAVVLYAIRICSSATRRQPLHYFPYILTQVDVPVHRLRLSYTFPTLDRFSCGRGPSLYTTSLTRGGPDPGSGRDLLTCSMAGACGASRPFTMGMTGDISPIAPKNTPIPTPMTVPALPHHTQPQRHDLPSLRAPCQASAPPTAPRMLLPTQFSAPGAGGTGGT
jgi:hypothetical protein